MDFSISKAALSEILSVTQSFIAKKTTMPILNNFLISAADGKVRISATDLELTAVASSAAQVRSSGSTTINAKVFSDIVRELEDGDVTIKLGSGERVEISSKGSKLRMIGVSAEEFPSLPGINYEPKGKISSKLLSEMIGKTIFAVSLDETRFNLNGVCFEVEPGEGKKAASQLRLVATDGHRLGLITRPVTGFDLQSRIIVPRKGLAEIKRILDAAGDTEVGIEVREGFLVLEARDAKISIHLIDGEFPDYNQVIPKGKGTKAIINSEELSQALRRVVLMVTDKSKCVRLDFAPDSIRISSSSPELGDAVEEIPARYSGEAISVGFNALYVLDFIATLSTPQNIVLELNGVLGPGKFSPENDESFIGIVMPMRL